MIMTRWHCSTVGKWWSFKKCSESIGCEHWSLGCPHSSVHHPNQPQTPCGICVRDKTMQLLKDITGDHLHELGLGKYLLSRTSKALVLTKNINTLYYINIKNFSSARQTIKRMTKQVTRWEEIFTLWVSGKGLYFI